MHKQVVNLVSFIGILLVCGSFINAGDIPVLPEAYYGTILGASAGITITAYIGSTTVGSIITTLAGVYGGATTSSEKLTVCAAGERVCTEGAPITFTASDGGIISTILTFTPGAITELNLDYTPPPISIIEEFSDYPVDTNSNGLYDYLIVQVPIKVTEVRDYYIQAHLNNTKAFFNDRVYLGPDDNFIYLNFPGFLIYDSAVNGPYSLDSFEIEYQEEYDDITIYNMEDGYYTKVYNYLDFERPAVTFTGYYNDYGLDTDGNGLYDYLVAVIGVNVTKAGNYSIESTLKNTSGSSIMYYFETKYFSEGLNNVSILFNGSEIYKKQKNGPYMFSYIIIRDLEYYITDRVIEPYNTSYYSYIDFEREKEFGLLCDANYACSSGNGDNNYAVGGNYLCKGFYDEEGNCDYANSCYYSDICDIDCDSIKDANFSRFPKPFVKFGEFNGLMILGDNAPPEDVIAGAELGISLQYHMRNIETFLLSNNSIINITTLKKIPTGNVMLSSEFDDTTNKNLIIIGEPCSNPSLFPYLNVTNQRCRYFFLNENRSILKLLYDEDKDRTVLLVVGKTPSSTRNAASILVQYDSYNLEGDELIVEFGNIITPSCNNDNYCGNDETFFSCPDDCSIPPEWTRDTDNDGIPDYTDEDDDNDGSNDTLDMVLGNASHINTSTINPIIEIDGDDDVNKQFTGIRNISVKDGNKPIIEFQFNFSHSSLSFPDITFEKETNDSEQGYFFIKGLSLPPGFTKIIYVNNKNNLTSLCIKDAEISSITEISSLCNGADEYGISCPGTANNDLYNCTFTDNTNTTFKITGLKHTGIQQQTYCGDGSCNPGEDCSSCSTDCGSCSVTSKGGSGGGGGGGGGGSASASISESQHFGNIPAGGISSKEYSKSEQIAVNKIKISVKNSVNNVRIEIKKASKPLNAPDPISEEEGGAYKYISIVTTNIKDDNINRAYIGFKIEKEWLNNSYDKNKVTLNRYKEGEWTKLPTRKIVENNDYVFYEAETTGFSIFAITAEKITEQITETEETDESKIGVFTEEDLFKPEEKKINESNHETPPQQNKGFFSRIIDFIGIRRGTPTGKAIIGTQEKPNKIVGFMVMFGIIICGLGIYIVLRRDNSKEDMFC